MSFVLSGCTLRLAYHFLDWGLQWKLQHYLALNTEQRALAKAAIAEFHRWHQQHELPRYVEFLEKTQQRLALGGEYSAAELHQQSDAVQDYIDAAITHLTPDLARLAASLSDLQITELGITLAADRRDYEKLYVKPDAITQQAHLAKELQNFLENYLGKLTHEQAIWVQDWSRQIQPFGEIVLAQQLIWAQQVDVLLRQQRPAIQQQASLRELLMYRSERWAPAARDLIRANEQLTLVLLARIANSLNLKQRQTLNDKIDTYLEDCRQLILAAAKA